MSRLFQRLFFELKIATKRTIHRRPLSFYTTDYVLTAARSKPHRYLFVLFREPVDHGLDLKPEDVGGEEFTQRRSFKPVEFAKKHGLELVGVNWMKVAADGWE